MIFFKNKPKLLIKFFIINIILVIAVLASFDYLIYKKYYKEKNYFNQAVSYTDNYKCNFTYNSYMYQKELAKSLNIFRLHYETQYKDKNPILIFGCSFAYGGGLKNEQIVSYKLSNILKRNVLNFATCTCGIQHMFFLLQNNLFYEMIEKEPTHAIYIFIPDHIRRMRNYISGSPLYTNGINLKYKLKNNELILEKVPFTSISKIFLIKSIYHQIDLKRDYNSDESKNYNSKLAYKLFHESRRLLQEKYPNIKFVILRYELIDDEWDPIEPEDLWKQLEKDGFIIINSSDLVGRKFKLNSEDTNEDKYHPSEAAWDLLVPPLVKELNL